jgi:hypothetical protein
MCVFDEVIYNFDELIVCIDKLQKKITSTERKDGQKMKQFFYVLAYFSTR